MLQFAIALQAAPLLRDVPWRVSYRLPNGIWQEARYETEGRACEFAAAWQAATGRPALVCFDVGPFAAIGA